jgi:hypothetical protein
MPERKHLWDRLRNPLNNRATPFSVCCHCGALMLGITPVGFRAPGDLWSSNMPPCTPAPTPSTEERIKEIERKLSPSGLRGFQQIAASARALQRAYDLKQFAVATGQAELDRFREELDRLFVDALARLEGV